MTIDTGSAKKPVASLSMDLDNQWSYMKTHGDAGWESFPSYLDIVVPRILDLLDEMGLVITFFVVGQDAAMPENQDAIRQLSLRNHELGNHSFRHEPWVHRYGAGEIEREVRLTDEWLHRLSGRKPVGYRGPGFSWDRRLLKTLWRHGYLYDASTLPSFLGPVARMYYFRTADLSTREKEARSKLFGRFTDGFNPVKPYLVDLGRKRQILEIPVTTVPWLKTPFHLSYLIYLNRISPLMMRWYLAVALKLCSLSGIGPSFLLHPLDVLGGDTVPELRFFPGMDVNTDRKIRTLKQVIGKIRNHFTIRPMKSHAACCLAQMNPVPPGRNTV